MRDEVAKGTELGSGARMFLERGELVPDETVLELMGRWMESAGSENGFLSDGFPRTLAQAVELDHWLTARDVKIDIVFYLHCEESLVVGRISGRRVCVQCGRNFHLKSMPPKVDQQCDDCGVALVQRADDTEPLVRRRFQIYMELTEPLVSYYAHWDKLAIVDATLPPEAMLDDVRKCLGT